MGRSGAQADAGRPPMARARRGVRGAGFLVGYAPLADWERELLTGGDAAAAPAADGAATPLPEAPAEPPTVTANEVAPTAGVPATGDTDTGTQGAQNG